MRRRWSASTWSTISCSGPSVDGCRSRRKEDGDGPQNVSFGGATSGPPLPCSRCARREATRIVVFRQEPMEVIVIGRTPVMQLCWRIWHYAPMYICCAAIDIVGLGYVKRYLRLCQVSGQRASERSCLLRHYLRQHTSLHHFAKIRHLRLSCQDRNS